MIQKPKNWRRRAALLGFLGFVLPGVVTLRAASQYFSITGGTVWDGTTTADWGAASGGPYGAKWTNGNTAVLEGTAGTVTVSATDIATVGGIIFSNTGYTLTGGQLNIGNNPLTVAQGLASANLTINSVLANGTGANTNLTVNNLGGTRGTVTLGGANSFTGVFQDNNTLVSINTIANGGTASSVGAGANTVPVVVCSGASFASVTYTGAGGSTDRPWVTGGTGGGQLYNSGSGAVNFNNPGSAVSGSGNRSWTFGGSYTANASTFAELIGDASGGSTAVNCAGSYWALTGANTFGGGVTINGGGVLSAGSLNYVASGTLSPNTGSSLGHPVTTANGTINFGNGTSFTGGTLKYTGLGETTDRIINLNNTTGGGVLDQSGTGLLKFTSGLTVTVNGAKTLTLQGSTAGTGEFAGAIVDSGSGATALAKSGSGTWILSGNNTYSGTTTVTAGALLVNGSIASASTVTVQSGAILGGYGTIGGNVTFNNGAYATNKVLRRFQWNKPGCLGSIGGCNLSKCSSGC